MFSKLCLILSSSTDDNKRRQRLHSMVTIRKHTCVHMGAHALFSCSFVSSICVAVVRRRDPLVCLLYVAWVSHFLYIAFRWLIILNYQYILLLLKSIGSVRNGTVFINMSEISEVVGNFRKYDKWITSVWSADFETEVQV